MLEIKKKNKVDKIQQQSFKYSNIKYCKHAYLDILCVYLVYNRVKLKNINNLCCYLIQLTYIINVKTQLKYRTKI